MYRVAAGRHLAWDEYSASGIDYERASDLTVVCRWIRSKATILRL